MHANIFKNKRKNINVRRYFIITLLVISCLLFIIFSFKYFLLLLFFIICIASMYPLRYAPWFGFFDMNIILTAYSTINYGLASGIFISNASVLGLLFFNPDINVIIDTPLSYMVAITSMFLTSMAFSSAIIIISIAYIVISAITHTLCRTMDYENIIWYVTMFSWILLVSTKIIKYL